MEVAANRARFELPKDSKLTRITQVVCGLVLACGLHGAAHAAPIFYSFDVRPVQLLTCLGGALDDCTQRSNYGPFSTERDYRGYFSVDDKLLAVDGTYGASIDSLAWPTSMFFEFGTAGWVLIGLDYGCMRGYFDAIHYFCRTGGGEPSYWSGPNAHGWVFHVNNGELTGVAGGVLGNAGHFVGFNVNEDGTSDFFGIIQNHVNRDDGLMRFRGTASFQRIPEPSTVALAALALLLAAALQRKRLITFVRPVRS